MLPLQGDNIAASDPTNVIYASMRAHLPRSRVHPYVRIYPWARTNSHFVYGSSSGIAFGSRPVGATDAAHPGLFLDASLEWGSSAAAPGSTFGKDTGLGEYARCMKRGETTLNPHSRSSPACTALHSRETLALIARRNCNSNFQCGIPMVEADVLRSARTLAAGNEPLASALEFRAVKVEAWLFDSSKHL
eukprot:scaffold71669_cov36-Tisochrysis_lutea.AAC.2